MSSTSSSECMCGECFNYGPGYGSPGFRPRAPPYYQTLGHPLIYYAQVQQTPNYPKRSRESRRGSPNCFVKAFRWYTQERCQPQHRELPSDRTDLNGFAVWLDKKYDEFILDKRAEQNDHQVQPPGNTNMAENCQIQPSCTATGKTGTLEANENSTSVVCDLRVKKKFARMRSPWKKRRRPVNGNEAGDVLDKCQQNFEFIMKPKELSRQASECCHQKSRNLSDISTVTLASKKTIIKSHSSDKTDYEKRNYTPITVIKHKGDLVNASKLNQSKSEIHTCHQTVTAKEMKDEICQFPEEHIEITDVKIQCTIIEREGSNVCPPSDYNRNTKVTRENTAQVSEGPSQVRDEDGSNPKLKDEAPQPLYNHSIAKHETSIKCQCSEIMVVKRDAQIQQTKNEAVCACRLSDNDLKSLKRPSSSHQSHPKVVLALEQIRPLVHKDAGTETLKSAPRNIPIRFESGEAQTSDHSIRFDKNTYPLFMKIVYADKLK